MQPKKKEHPKEKSELHPRNKHRERYDFKQLVDSCPELIRFVIVNKFRDESIDFSDPESVRCLNKALLKHFYDIDDWDIPKNYLCPPIPGRADYIHYMADLLSQENNGKIPRGPTITCLDIGVGANCVYPLIGNKEYGWSFIGSEIDPVAIRSANNILFMNPALKGKIEIRPQHDQKYIISGAIGKNEYIDLVICNPPFHTSAAEAAAATERKVTNLNHGKVKNPVMNFGGQHNELWCKGGEAHFVREMVQQSKNYAASCFWFSTLISKQSNLDSVYAALKKAGALEIKTIPMEQGNKISRIVAWTYLTKEQRHSWIQTRWNKQT